MWPGSKGYAEEAAQGDTFGACERGHHGHEQACGIWSGDGHSQELVEFYSRAIEDSSAYRWPSQNTGAGTSSDDLGCTTGDPVASWPDASSNADTAAQTAFVADQIVLGLAEPWTQRHARWSTRIITATGTGQSAQKE